MYVLMKKNIYIFNLTIKKLLKNRKKGHLILRPQVNLPRTFWVKPSHLIKCKIEMKILPCQHTKKMTVSV